MKTLVDVPEPDAQYGIRPPRTHLERRTARCTCGRRVPDSEMLDVRGLGDDGPHYRCTSCVALLEARHVRAAGGTDSEARRAARSAFSRRLSGGAP